MFNSLRARLLLTYLGLGGVVLLIVGVTLLVYVVRNPLPVRQTQARLHAILTEARNLERIQTLPAEDWASLLQRADQAQDVRFIILNQRGEILIDSRGGSEPVLRGIRIPRRLQQDPTRILSGNFQAADNTVWLYALRTLGDGRFIAAATPRPSIPWRAIIRDDLLPPFIQGGLVALALAVLLPIFMSRWVSAPLQRMAESVHGFAKGEYKPIPLTGPNEVRALAGAFNEMTEQVHASRQSQVDFVANVSHELKTPLTSIQGFAQALLDGTANDPATIQQSAEIISDEAGRMHRLVIDLLDLARLDGGTAIFQRAPLDMAALLQTIAQRLTPQAQEKQIDLQLTVDALPAMVGDGDRLAQVFTNLLDNALKHTPEGGVVAVRAQYAGGLVETAIADSGPGIPPGEQVRIFERFYQLDKSRAGGRGRGMGLGLTIANEIIQAHGGTIRIHSKPGQGSIFVVQLPVVQPDDTTITRKRG